MSAHWHLTWPGVHVIDVATLAFQWPNQVLLAGVNDINTLAFDMAQCVNSYWAKENSQSWANDVGTLAFHWPSQVLLARASKGPGMSTHWCLTFGQLYE